MSRKLTLPPAFGYGNRTEVPAQSKENTGLEPCNYAVVP
jgi:hypothetical protein